MFNLNFISSTEFQIMVRNVQAVIQAQWLLHNGTAQCMHPPNHFSSITKAMSLLALRIKMS